jgi:hypothetical protein
MNKLKWNLLMLKLDVDIGLVSMIVFLIVLLIICFSVSYGMTRWQDHEAVKWNVEHHRSNS